MSNLEKYNNAFVEVLKVDVNNLEGLEYQGIPAWDSIAHMQLISSLEDAFGIEMDADDIIDFSSYLIGKEILSKYEIAF
jgi:acyl carrier protein